MVEFTELRISRDGKHLKIKANVQNKEYYSHVTISDIYINTEKTFLQNRINITSCIYHNVFDKKKEIELDLTLDDFVNRDKDFKDFSSNLFFIYIRVAGTPDITTPCGRDSEYTLGIVFDIDMLYNQALQYIDELNNKCEVPKAFTNFILQWEGFKMLLGAGQYTTAIKVFNKLFKKRKGLISHNCNCHG